MKYIKNGLVISTDNPVLIALYDASSAYERVEDAQEQTADVPKKRTRKE